MQSSAGLPWHLFSTCTLIDRLEQQKKMKNGVSSLSGTYFKMLVVRILVRNAWLLTDYLHF